MLVGCTEGAADLVGTADSVGLDEGALERVGLNDSVGASEGACEGDPVGAQVFRLLPDLPMPLPLLPLLDLLLLLPLHLPLLDLLEGPQSLEPLPLPLYK